MGSARLYLSAMLATIKRDARVFFTYRMRLPVQLLGILFTLTSFYYISKIVRPGAVGAHGDYFSYALVGVVATSILSSALMTSQIVRTELAAGNFERIVISPMGPVWGVVSIILFPIIYAAGFAVLTFATAVLVYAVPIDAANIVPACGVALLGALSMGAIGLLFVAMLIAVKSAAGAAWVVAGLSLLGGAYFPLRLFPAWVRWVADVQPFTPTVELLRHLLTGTRPTEAVWVDVVKLVGFASVLGPISFAVLWFAVGISRRRGTMLEF